MNRRKQLRIGTSDYQQFIATNGYFVDKTLFIKEVIDNAHEVMLIPRPRRFGKTLNLSMLRYYFDAGLKDTAKLFEPYLIWKEAGYYTAQQSKYPVIYLTLKGAKATTFETSQQDIYLILTAIYRDFQWLLEKNILNASEKADFQKITSRQANSSIYETSLKNLCSYLYRYYGEKTIVIMDEYDAPIHTGFQYGFYDAIIQTMKSLMGATFKDNPYLYKGVITGILRIAKESIFSDFNNPGIFTTLSYSFADKFGFTEAEVQKLLAYFGLEEKFDLAKEWYDGYQFGDIKSIYNPWSILNYLDKYREGLKPYWVNSSSDELIKNQITAKNAADIRTDLETLIKGRTIEKYIDENIIFSDFHKDKEVFWALLLFSGYLSVTHTYRGGWYQLSIPNQEVKTLFTKIILEWLKRNLHIRFDTLRAMAHSLTTNQIDAFKIHFKSIMSDTFSYFDVHTEPERVYQAYVLGLLSMLGDDYVIKSNRESGKGRYDILLLPRNLADYGIIMEIKQLDKDANQKNIQAELKAALGQIQKNQYYKELEAHEVQKRIEMAMVFVGKEVYLAVS